MQSSLLKKFKKNIDKSAHSHGIRSIRVFGSFARGEENADSDIDFLVELEPNRSLLDIFSMKYEIEDLTGRTVDVVTTRGISPYLVEQIMKKAVPLFPSIADAMLSELTQFKFANQPKSC
jgi:uncharacterized protein